MFEIIAVVFFFTAPVVLPAGVAAGYAARRRRRLERDKRCPACDYQLPATDVECPECGWPVSQRVRGRVAWLVVGAMLYPAMVACLMVVHIGRLLPESPVTAFHGELAFDLLLAFVMLVVPAWLTLLACRVVWIASLKRPSRRGWVQFIAAIGGVAMLHMFASYLVVGMVGMSGT